MILHEVEFKQTRPQHKGAYTLQKISLEKIVLRMRSAENFPFRGKFSEVYICTLKSRNAADELTLIFSNHVTCSLMTTIANFE